MAFLQTSAWRRIYAFLAVALAVFLVSMSLVGMTYHGFAEEPVADARETVPVDEAKPEANASIAASKAALEKVSNDLATAGQRWKTAAEKTKKTLDEYQQATAALDEFVATHFGDLMQSADAGEKEAATFSVARKQFDARQQALQQSLAQLQASSTAPPPEVQAVQVPQAVPNPKWQELQKDLADLQRRRTDALIIMQPSHPAIQAMNFSIAEIENQLKSIPETIPANGGSPASPPPTAIVTPAPSPPAIQIEPLPVPKSIASEQAPKWRQENAKFRELSDQARAAELKYRQALDAESLAWKQNSTAMKSAVENAVKQTEAIVVAPPVTAAPLPGPRRLANPRLSILLCALLAIVAGAWVALSARRPEAVFHSASEVRHLLGIPVLGELDAETNLRKTEQPRREPNWTTSALRASEWCLAAMCGFLIFAALADRGFFLSLMADPLAACTHKFWC